MASLRRLILRLLTFLRSGHAEDELAKEIASHVAILEDEYRARGSSADEARLAARRALGGVELTKDLQRDARSFAWLEDVRRDCRHTLRGLRRTPGFIALAVVTLGLGLGVNNTFFTLVNAICLRGLPLDEPDRVLFLATRNSQDLPAGLSFAEFEDLRTASKSFTEIAAFASSPMTIADEGRPADQVSGAVISSRAFDLLGQTPILGRGFLAEDDRLGAPPVVILGGGLWNTRYASDPGIISRTISVNGHPSTVIGVMPAGFRFPGTADLWQPLSLIPGRANPRRENRALGVFGRLRDGVTEVQARAEVETIGRTWAADFAENRGIRPTAIPINDQFTGRITDRAWLAFITAGVLVVLIACANVANLLLMRAATRSREIAIRTAIGGSRRSIVRQLLMESTLLAVLGALVGVLFSVISVRLLSTLIPPDTLPYWMELAIDGRVLAVVTFACLASVFVFGLAPALHLSKIDVSRGLSEGARAGNEAIPARRWMACFLAAEFALTLVLLAVVLMGVRQTRAIARAEFPIDSAPLLTMWVTLPTQAYDTPSSRMAFSDRLQERLGELGGVASVSVTNALPLASAFPGPVVIEGRPPVAGEPPQTAFMVMIGDRYFETLGVPIVRGRPFTATDGVPGAEAAIVNERFAQRFFANDDPIGHLLRIGPAASPRTRIIGVSRTVRQQPVGLEPEPVVYLPFRMVAPPTMAILLRAEGDPRALTSSVREEVRRIDANLALYRVMTFEEAMHIARWNGRLSDVLIRSIASIALIMALVGLYAVTANAVQRLKKELGIRMALGARPRELAWLTLRRAIVQLSVGLAIGIVCTYAFDKLFSDPTSGIRMTDSIALLPLVAVVVMVAIAACVLPMRRAARLDPVVVLRYE